jgi:hypothetical protein
MPGQGARSRRSLRRQTSAPALLTTDAAAPLGFLASDTAADVSSGVDMDIDSDSGSADFGVPAAAAPQPTVLPAMPAPLSAGVTPAAPAVAAVQACSGSLGQGRRRPWQGEQGTRGPRPPQPPPPATVPVLGIAAPAPAFAPTLAQDPAHAGPQLPPSAYPPSHVYSRLLALRSTGSPLSLEPLLYSDTLPAAPLLRVTWQFERGVEERVLPMGSHARHLFIGNLMTVLDYNCFPFIAAMLRPPGGGASASALLLQFSCDGPTRPLLGCYCL